MDTSKIGKTTFRFQVLLSPRPVLSQRFMGNLIHVLHSTEEEDPLGEFGELLFTFRSFFPTKRPKRH